MPTPEIPIDQKVTERPEGPSFSESLQQSGISPAPTNVKPVVNDQGQPIITTPATISGKIHLPADPPTLLVWSKGSITNAITWLGKFFLRMIAKENSEKMGSPRSGEDTYANNNTE